MAYKINKQQGTLVLPGLILMCSLIGNILLIQQTGLKSTELTKRQNNADKEIPYLSKQLLHAQSRSSEYKDRLTDIHIFLKSPESIGYQLPYNNDTYKVEDANYSYFSKEDYTRDNCSVGWLSYDSFGKVIKDMGYTRYESCIEKYTSIYESWNPSF